MLEQSLTALAQYAGQTVVAAAITDGWDAARPRFARLLGHGNARKTEAVERWLAETREQLTAAADADLESVRAPLARRWEDRFADLLDEDPGVEADLRALVEEIAATPRAEHHGDLATRDSIAQMMGKAGDPAGARDQFAELLAIRTRILGPEHPDTLATRASLANWTGKAGDVTGARDQYAALLAIRERILGPEHPDSLATRASIAQRMGQEGDPAGARDQFAELLAIRTRILGPEHPDTLATRASLANWTGRAGNVTGARDQYAELLAIAERVLGHKNALEIRFGLNYWRRRAGDPPLPPLAIAPSYQAKRKYLRRGRRPRRRLESGPPPGTDFGDDDDE